MNVESLNSNGISVLWQAVHPSKDWKVLSATLSYCLLTWTTAYFSLKSAWDTEFCWPWVAYTQHKMKVSQQAKQLFLIWRFQEWRPRYGSALLIKLCCSLYFHENSVFYPEGNKSVSLLTGPDPGSQFYRWLLHHPTICSWTHTEDVQLLGLTWATLFSDPWKQVKLIKQTGKSRQIHHLQMQSSALI